MLYSISTPCLSHNTFPTWQRSSLRWGNGACVVHPSKKSQLRSVCRGVLVLPLMPPPSCPNGRAPVGGLGLLGGAQVVEVPAVWACADSAIQAHGALARLLGLAFARPHVQTWDESQWWVRMQYFKSQRIKTRPPLGCYHLCTSICQRGLKWLVNWH